eukprot:5800136-Alexandrium_andersonii.AAC.1
MPVAAAILKLRRCMAAEALPFALLAGLACSPSTRFRDPPPTIRCSRFPREGCGFGWGWAPTLAPGVGGGAARQLREGES